MPGRCQTPLRFAPLFRRYLWGGRRLADRLGKPLGPGNDYAESWEIVDRPDDQSVVQFGPLRGLALGELVRQHGSDLLGRHAPQPRFPLLMKILDCQRTLSVQVHPNDRQAALLQPPDLGKTEAWVVLDAEPESRIYAGLRPGMTAAALRAALAAGDCDACLHQFAPQPGDCLFIPAGVVHALGAGLLIAEIQQASDATFRLFDFNRVDAQGRSRPLHVEQALAVIDFARGPVAPQRPTPTELPWRETLVACDKFLLHRCRADRPVARGCEDRCTLVTVLEGTVGIEGDPADRPLAAGETALVPAAAGQLVVHPRAASVWLESSLPD